jgi:hypothetical protein
MAAGARRKGAVPRTNRDSGVAVETAFANRVPRRHPTQGATMKGWMAIAACGWWLAVGAPALAQTSSPPPLPTLTPQQSSEVERRLDAYRRQTEDRVTRGEITADEADRLVQWRECQIARNVAGVASAPPPDYGAPPDYVAPPDYDARAPQVVVVEPPRYYVPYYPYPYPAPYWGPRAYYSGPSICAGGFGHHFGGRICF